MKQNSISLSNVEAKYVAVGSCCAQLFRNKQQLLDFCMVVGMVSILSDNTSSIDIRKNLVQHMHTKKIDIRHHYLRDNVEK